VATVYLGKAPLTIVRCLDGRAVYVYAGQPAPGGVDAVEVDRLVTEGYLVPVVVPDAVLDVDLVPATPPLAVARPAQSAQKSEWVDYAVSMGMPPAEAEASKKQDLIDLFREPAAAVDPAQLGPAESVDVVTPAAEAIAEQVAVQPAVTVERPLQVAVKSAWVDYAVAQGADPAAAEAMTKQELVEQYGG